VWVCVWVGVGGWVCGWVCVGGFVVPLTSISNPNSIASNGRQDNNKNKSELLL